MLAAAVIVAAFVAWEWHANRPETIAAKALAEGDRLAEAGQVGKAAQKYRKVAVELPSQAGTALDKLQALIDHRLDAADTRGVCEALAIAVDIQRVKQESVNLVEKGVEQSQRRADADATGALAILAVVEPLAPADAKLLAVKLDLLQKAVASNPEDLDAISGLAQIWEVQKEFAKCEALLAKHQAKLGAREGAAHSWPGLPPPGQARRGAAAVASLRRPTTGKAA